MGVINIIILFCQNDAWSDDDLYPATLLGEVPTQKRQEE
jgi:hypothetical protein